MELSQISGVYFVKENKDGPIYDCTGRLITLNKDVAVKVPFIAPILQSDQWTKTKPDNNGRIAITLLSHPLLTLNALISLCKQLQSLTKEDKVAVQVSNENELWLADYLSIPVRTNLLDVNGFLAMINLSQTKTFRRIKDNEDVKLLWRSMLWHWCYYGATLTMEQMKLVPIGFIEMYLEHVVLQPDGFRCAFMIQPLFDESTLASIDKSKHNPFLDMIKVLMKLSKSRTSESDVKSIQKLFDQMSDLNFKPSEVRTFIEQNKEFVLKYCSRTFLERCVFFEREYAWTNTWFAISVSTRIVQTSTNKLFLSFSKGTFDLKYNSNGLLSSIESPVTFVLHYPCFSRYIIKENGATRKLVYVLSENDLAMFCQYPGFPIIIIAMNN